MKEDRITSLSPTEEEQQESLHNPLRPKFLKDYIGQESMKRQMRVFIDAAKARGETLDHTLIYGPPGLGKTTLAHIIANEFQTSVVMTSGPSLMRAADLATLVTSLRERQVLFIDEIHRMHRAVEEMLYSAMEDQRLDILLGEGVSARSVSLPLPPFTLIGATTRTGLMSKPLFDRFGITQHLNFYDPQALEEIVLRSAGIKEIELGEGAAFEIARRSRGTPRIANRLLMRLRDFAHARKERTLSLSLSREAVSEMGIDECGLNREDRAFLSVIIDHFGGGPVGIGTLAAALHESRDTLEDTLEPYLIQSGYLQRTSRGRIATESAYLHLQKPLPQKRPSDQPTLGLE